MPHAKHPRQADWMWHNAQSSRHPPSHAPALPGTRRALQHNALQLLRCKLNAKSCTLRIQKILAGTGGYNIPAYMATAWSATNAGLKCCMKSLVKGFRMPPAASIDTACMQEGRVRKGAERNGRRS